MKKTEETARELCRLDLLRIGPPEEEARPLVERFWPVLANEIRQGIVFGEWPFSRGRNPEPHQGISSSIEPMATR